MRLLLLNPNTSAGVTALCAEAARAVASPDTTILPVTAMRGPVIIATRAELALAERSVLELLAEHAGQYDAVLLAVSFDTGLLAAREVARVPVLGMTEAALLTACLVAQRFALVAFGQPALYRELVAARGLEGRLAGLEVIDADPRDVLSEPERIEEAVVAAGANAVARGAEAVVVCGAAMAGFGARLKPRLPVPVVDGIACGVVLAEALVRLHLAMPATGSLAPPGPRASQGLDPALATWLARHA